ncbi:MAG: DMT family transporter [Rhodospirillaceae bacterium]|jgi:drug/metabolite transporter (DMT)-like permease|nr:DMT family transporter [Rhodospirillaceae bacterium]
MTDQAEPSLQTGPPTGVRSILSSPYAALVIAMFCWGGIIVLVRYVRDDFPPLGLSFWRIFIAFFILLPFSIGPLRRQWSVVRENWKIFALLSLLFWVGGNALLFLSLQYTVALNAGVINSAEPLLIVLFAWLLFRDPFTRKQGFGLVLSLLGVVVLISRGSLDRLLQLDFNKGDLFVAAAYTFWSLYAVLLRKIPRGLDQRVILTVLLGFGSIYLFPLYLAETTYIRPVPLNLANVATAVFVAIFASLIPMLLWNFSILKLGPGRAGQFVHLISVFSVLLAITFLGEIPGTHHMAGIALIVTGLIIAARR